MERDNNNLWAPWRMEYIRGMNDEDDGECFLCDAWEKVGEEEERLVIYRNDEGMILLNRFPYTNGHLLVAMSGHVGNMVDMKMEERGALMELTCLTQRLLETAMGCQGMNIGVNVGRCGGAGLVGHLHVHVVPRWGGDTNFMTVVGGVRVVPESLEEIYGELVGVLGKVL